MTTGTDFIWFATGSAANVQDQADYSASAGSGIVAGGFQSGILLSPPFNKALRQGSAGSAALGVFVYDNTGNYQSDDGNTQNFANGIAAAVHAIAVGAGAGGGVSSFNTRTGAVTLTSGDVTTALAYTPAHTGANADITSLSGLTTPLSTFQGGTGVNTGNAPTASKWVSARTLSFTGDATGSATVDGSANVATALTLAATGVTPGAYLNANVTVDAKGRVTAISRAVKVTYGNLASSSGGPWGEWDPNTGLTLAWGYSSTAVTAEGEYSITFPMNIGTYHWAIAQAGNNGSTNLGSCVMQTVVGSGSGTGVSFFANDSQASGAYADGFFWEARGYSSTQP